MLGGFTDLLVILDLTETKINSRKYHSPESEKDLPSHEIKAVMRKLVEIIF